MTIISEASSHAIEPHNREKPKDKSDIFYLIYSLFYFFPLLFLGDFIKEQGPLWWLGLMGVYGVFVGIYCSIIHSHKEQYRWLLASMLLLSILGTFVFVGTSALFAYCAFYACFLFEGRERLLWFGLTLLGIAVGAIITGFVWYFWVIALTIALVNAANASLEVQRDKFARHQNRIDSLEARDRLASDLHDVTGHHLVAITLKAQLTQKLITAGEYAKAQAELKVIAELASDNRKAIRQAIEGGLPNNAAQTFADLEALLGQNGFEFTKLGELPTFAAAYNAEIAAIFSEVFTNILRHASQPKASWSHVVTPAGYQLHMLNPANSEFKQGNGLGLRSMASRAERLGGTVEFAISPKGEAEFRLKLPLNCLQV